MKSLSSTSNSKPKTARHFIARCALFAVLLFALHALAYFVRGPRDLPPDAALLMRAALDPEANILFFGDSTLFMGHPGEADTASTPAMLQQLLPDRNVVEISSAASQMELYELFAHYLERKQAPTQYVIFPLNMRLLAPQLEDHSYRYFDRERAFLENDNALFRILFRPLAVFKTFDHRSATQDEFHDAPVLDGATNLGPLGRFNPASAIPVSAEQRARIVTFSYMYSLSPQQRAIQQLESAVQALQNANITPILYITPIDYEACESDLGPRFTQRLNENAQFLKDLLAERGVPCIDLSTEIPTAQFSWRHYPNEHLRAEGRHRIARRLAETIRELD